MTDHFMNDPPLTESSGLATLIEGFKAVSRAFEISCGMAVEGYDEYIPPENAIYVTAQKLHVDLNEGADTIFNAIIKYPCFDAADVGLKSRFVLRYLEAGCGISEDEYDDLLRSFTEVAA